MYDGSQGGAEVGHVDGEEYLCNPVQPTAAVQGADVRRHLEEILCPRPSKHAILEDSPRLSKSGVVETDSVMTTSAMQATPRPATP